MRAKLACLLVVVALVFPLSVWAQHRVFLPVALANYTYPPPPVPTVPPRTWAKGLSIFRRSSDFTLTGSTYAVTWWEPRTSDQLTAGPTVTVLCQVRDMSDLAELDLYAGQTMIRLFNEPELSGQANMTLEQVVDGIHAVHVAYPDALLGTPELVVDYGYTHRQVVDRYRIKYGDFPPYSFAAIHAYAWDAASMLGALSLNQDELEYAGFGDLPVWVTEFGPYPDPYAADWRGVVDTAVAWFDAHPQVVMAAYHPAYEWTWGGGSWTGTALCNEDGTLTEIGAWWAGIH